LYIGVTLLRWPERDVWRMTPYKILTLFKIHKRFNPERFKPEPAAQGGEAEGEDIHFALTGGL